MPVFLIPADRGLPCRIVDLDESQDWYSAVGKLIDSSMKIGVYDRGAVLWAHGNGAAEGLPVNQRTVPYVRGHSAAAPRIPSNDTSYQFNGDVVFTGGRNGEPGGSVPDRLVTILTADGADR